MLVCPACPTHMRTYVHSSYTITYIHKYSLTIYNHAYVCVPNLHVFRLYIHMHAHRITLCTQVHRHNTFTYPRELKVILTHVVYVRPPLLYPDFKSVQVVRN